ncbi:MAG TPA: hypothetical protein VF765_18655 [Polyangiaceae bacterium]
MRLRFAHAAALAVLTACTSSNGNGVDASLDHLGVVPGSEAGGDDGGGDAQGGTQTTLRLANMSPDVGAVDFCWRVSGSATFTGPVLGGSLDGGTPGSEPEEAGATEAGEDSGAGEDAGADAAEPADATAETGAPVEGGAADATMDAPAGRDAGDAGDAGVASDAMASDAAAPQPPVGFASMSAAVTLPTSGTLDIALVAAGQLSCGEPPQSWTVTLDAGKITTLAIMGLAGADAGSASALSIVAFTDELADAEVAKVRFVHAALGWPDGTSGPAPALSARAGSVVLAPEVDPGRATTPDTMPPVDPLGFASVAPVSGETVLTLSPLADGATQAWSTGLVGVDALPGTVHTGFIVSQRAGALGVAWCGVGPTVGVPTCRLWPAE